MRKVKRLAKFWTYLTNQIYELALIIETFKSRGWEPRAWQGLDKFTI